MTIKFNKAYALLFIVLLTVEILIAKFLKSGFIRYTFGDYLAVICLYCFFKSIIDSPALKMSILVLIISYVIEFLQLANFLSLLNIENNELLRVVLGSTFNTSDLLAYTLGIITVLIIEYKIYKLWVT